MWQKHQTNGSNRRYQNVVDSHIQKIEFYLGLCMFNDKSKILRCSFELQLRSSGHNKFISIAITNSQINIYLRYKWHNVWLPEHKLLTQHHRRKNKRAKCFTFTHSPHLVSIKTVATVKNLWHGRLFNKVKYYNKIKSNFGRAQNV